MEDTCARYGGEEINVGWFLDDWKQHLETLERVIEDYQKLVSAVVYSIANGQSRSLIEFSPLKFWRGMIIA